MSVYGTGFNNLSFRGFSRELDYQHYPRNRSLEVLSPSTSLADLPTKDISTGFNVLFRQYAVVSLLRPPFTVIKSTGILTSYPSESPLGLSLGPD